LGKRKIIVDDVDVREECKKYKKWNNIQQNELQEQLNEEELREKNELDLIYDPIVNTENKYEGIEQCYRQIRLNYEAGGEHPDAGDFYLHEMRVRGKRVKGFIKCLHWLYGLVSKYGESPSRAILWFLFIFVVSGFAYMFTGFSYINQYIHYYFQFDRSKLSTFITDYLFKALPYSLTRLIPAYFRDITQSSQANSLTTLISIIEALSGVIVLTLLILAVRRRFRRESQ
jgi:hypothetical protein